MQSSGVEAYGEGIDTGTFRLKQSVKGITPYLASIVNTIRFAQYILLHNILSWSAMSGDTDLLRGQSSEAHSTAQLRGHRSHLAQACTAAVL